MINIIYFIILLLFLIFIFSISEDSSDTIKKIRKKHNYPLKKCNYLNVYYEKTWHDYRELTFEKYGHCCAKCGSKEELQIHHIIPISKGGTNDLTNLIPLCKKCHEKIHKFKFQENNKQVPINYGKKISKKNKILKAIELNKRIKIKYKASKIYKNSELTQRIVKPIEITLGKYCDNKYIQQSTYDVDKPFLLAYCELRKENRLFRLDRILEIQEV